MSKYAYDYSLAFNSLKNTKEQLSDNHTTRDYIVAMETLLYNAVRPLVMTSEFSDTFLASVSAWYSTNAKRRISRLEKAEFFGLVNQMLVTEDLELKYELIKRMQFERTILFFLVDSWLRTLNGYTQTTVEYAKTKKAKHRMLMEQYEFVIGKRSDRTMSVFSAVRESRYWLRQFLDLKTMILEKYSRFIITTAQKDYKMMGHSVSLNDLIQNYVITSSRALDKCDFKQGTLTSYIQLWLKSARTRSSKTDSIDNSTNSPEGVDVQYDRVDITPSEDGSIFVNELSEEHGQEYEASNRDEIDNVRYLMKLVDPTGVFRLMTGIEEVLLPSELNAVQQK